jgi:hypothetical protein
MHIHMLESESNDESAINDMLMSRPVIASLVFNLEYRMLYFRPQNNLRAKSGGGSFNFPSLLSYMTSLPFLPFAVRK